MVIFHSYVNVYQRVYHIYVFQIVLYYILHELLTDYHHESTCVCPLFLGDHRSCVLRTSFSRCCSAKVDLANSNSSPFITCSLGSPNLPSGYVKIAIEHDHL
jgi:hypothetical protein